MKQILTYLRTYIAEIDKRLFALSTVFTAALIFINYRYGLNRMLSRFDDIRQYLGWYLVFLFTFSFAYVAHAVLSRQAIFKERKFVALVLIAPAIFAWKMSFDVYFNFSSDASANSYWNQVVYWPLKLAVMMVMLLIVWQVFDRQQGFYGMSWNNFSPAPYIWMLLIMVPLIAAASTQPDFLAMYPKLKNVLYLSGEQDSGFYKLLYELSYGSDFIGIELFFRGFLVLAFVKYAGKNAILPMAMFYCTIHFGKPLGECISSYFGGLLLGVVTYHTRTIYGGLMVHLGIAWLMELGGYVGSLCRV